MVLVRTGMAVGEWLAVQTTLGIVVLCNVGVANQRTSVSLTAFVCAAAANADSNGGFWRHLSAVRHQPVLLMRGGPRYRVAVGARMVSPVETAARKYSSCLSSVLPNSNGTAPARSMQR